MSLHPILLVGGSGVIGRCVAQYLRAAHPDVPLLIGGRNLARAQEVASEVGNAEGVALDVAADGLGLGERPVGAVAIFFRDETNASLRFAQSRGVPHLSISSAIQEMGPDVAAYIHRPDVAPIVLATEWLVGATSVPTLHLAKSFGRVDDITIGALIDEQDTGGPATTSDMERLETTKALSAALTRRGGAYFWRSDDEARAKFRAVDGTEMEASAFSAFEVVALATVTGAPNVQFNLATGVSSTRRRGEPMSTEIVIELAGEDHAGRPLRTRHAVVHPQGQMPLTSLGVAMMLERLVGLDGKPATPAGLYFPYQLLESIPYLARLERIGGALVTLDVL